MDFACDECRAIHQEIQEAFAEIKQEIAGQSATPEDLVPWIEQLDETECARVRETSPLWKTWRRFQEHRTLTGHSLLALPLPPIALMNPN